jgi:thiamine-phosphate pyrophosphorylase
MRRRQPDPVPRLWLVSDARNDAVLDAAILRLPRGSGVIFRHRHLAADDRRRRFAEVRRLCRRRGHCLMLAASPELAWRWGADGSYGPAAPQRALATAHGLREIGRANRCGAAAVLLSPLLATRSHPLRRPLGRVRFLLLARRSRAPVIALGGVSARRVRSLPVHGWAAIDALSFAIPMAAPADS